MDDSTEDSLAIIELLDIYFRGIYEGNVSMLNDIFHPCTVLFCDVAGQPKTKTLVLYLAGIARRQCPKDSGKPFKAEIRSLRVINAIATTLVSVSMYDQDYQEILCFHKMDSRWLIVNKMITHVHEQNIEYGI
jgi:hypothetical protein